VADIKDRQEDACWRCAAARLSSERIGRRESCPHCGADLHCCRNCRFYDPGRHNQCREPLAERQVDKERANFCEYFSPAGGPTADRRGDVRAQLAALFRPRRPG
jgi:hypothetical protein